MIFQNLPRYFILGIFACGIIQNCNKHEKNIEKIAGEIVQVDSLAYQSGNKCFQIKSKENIYDICIHFNNEKDSHRFDLFNKSLRKGRKVEISESRNPIDDHGNAIQIKYHEIKFLSGKN